MMIKYGTAIVVASALLNALKVVHKEMGTVDIVINGAGSAPLLLSTGKYFPNQINNVLLSCIFKGAFGSCQISMKR